MKVDKIDDDVFAAIVRNFGLEPGDDNAVTLVEGMGFDEAWRRYCVWNGLLGSFHLSLRSAYENLKAAQ